MGIVISLDKFSDELGKLAKEQVKQFKGAVVDALLKNIIDIVKASPVDTGLYAQSWDLEITEKQAIIGNYSPHAPIIEFGARPFTPPIGPLLGWAKRVLKKPDNDPHVWALAKYTQSKIAEFGMEPKHILTKQIDKIMEDIRINIRKALK